MEFRWNEDHIAKHGVTPREAESTVRDARRPYPRYERHQDTYLVQGRSDAGRLLQVVYLLDPDGTLYVIHARPLTEREKRRWRRRTK